MNIQYTYIVVKCKIYSYELEKQLEKRIFGELFWSVSHRVQVNFIFVYYVYPACNSITADFTEDSIEKDYNGTCFSYVQIM
jgi:hypothetical protein